MEEVARPLTWLFKKWPYDQWGPIDTMMTCHDPVIPKTPWYSQEKIEDANRK